MQIKWYAGAIKECIFGMPTSLGRKRIHSTSPLSILRLLNPWIDKLYVFQERRARDFKAPKL